MYTLGFEKPIFMIQKRSFTLVDHFHFLVHIHLNGMKYNQLVVLNTCGFHSDILSLTFVLLALILTSQSSYCIFRNILYCANSNCVPQAVIYVKVPLPVRHY